MIALPLWVASVYHQFKGTVMPQELLNTIKQHLASPDTSLDNGDDWGLVQKWLLMAAQKDGGGGGHLKVQISSGIPHSHPLVQRRPNPPVDHRKARLHWEGVPSPRA